MGFVIPGLTSAVTDPYHLGLSPSHPKSIFLAGRSKSWRKCADGSSYSKQSANLVLQRLPRPWSFPIPDGWKARVAWTLDILCEALKSSKTWQVMVPLYVPFDLSFTWSKEVDDKVHNVKRSNCFVDPCNDHNCTLTLDFLKVPEQGLSRQSTAAVLPGQGFVEWSTGQVVLGRQSPKSTLKDASPLSKLKFRAAS